MRTGLRKPSLANLGTSIQAAPYGGFGACLLVIFTQTRSFAGGGLVVTNLLPQNRQMAPGCPEATLSLAFGSQPSLVVSPTPVSMLSKLKFGVSHVSSTAKDRRSPSKLCSMSCSALKHPLTVSMASTHQAEFVFPSISVKPIVAPFFTSDCAMGSARRQ